MFIENELYQKIKSLLPILCVDLVITSGGKYLLIRRAQEPMKGEWWTVGGRVHHGESAEAAAHRKAKEEAGISICAPRFIGYYEDFYDNGVHTVSIVLEAERLGDSVVKLDAEATEYQWAESLPERLKIVR